MEKSEMHRVVLIGTVPYREAVIITSRIGEILGEGSGNDVRYDEIKENGSVLNRVICINPARMADPNLQEYLGIIERQGIMDRQESPVAVT